MKKLFLTLSFFAATLPASTIADNPSLASWDLTANGFACAGSVDCVNLTVSLTTAMNIMVGEVQTAVQISDPGVISTAPIITVSYFVTSDDHFYDDDAVTIASPDFMGENVYRFTQAINGATALTCYENYCGGTPGHHNIGIQYLGDGTTAEIVDTFYLQTETSPITAGVYQTIFASPEPASLFLLGSGLVGVYFIRRKLVN